MIRTGLIVFAVVAAATVCADNRTKTKDDLRLDADRVLAQAYLREHAVELGIKDLDDLRETQANRSAVTSAFRYQQFDRNVRVYSGELVVAVGSTSTVVHGHVVGHLDVEATPKLSAQRARQIVIDKLHLKGVPMSDAAELLILPKQSIDGKLPQEDRLVWEVSLQTDEDTDVYDDWTTYVDARSGEIIFQFSERANLTMWLGGPPFKGMYATRQFGVYGPLDNKLQYRYVLVRDPCYGTGLSLATYTQYVSNTPDSRLCGHSEPGPNGLTLWTPDGEGNWVGDSNGRLTTNGKPLKVDGQPSSIGTGVLGATDGLTAAADAFDSMYLAFRYLEMIHARAGLDTLNGPVVRALVRQPIDTAVWDRKTKSIQIGRQTGNYPLTSLDVVAHELGHGLSDFGPRLNRNGTESNKLDEANADMFAMLVSADNQSSPRHDAVPWWIGELTLASNYTNGIFQSTPGAAIRYLDDPARSGGFACYFAGIAAQSNHAGGGPAGHMFYLLTYGGVSKCDGSSVTGVGTTIAGKIWYDAFFRLLANSGYADLRLAFISAVQQLYPGPSVETASVEAAFNATQIP
jgi:Zn-dependent metalloprotease